MFIVYVSVSLRKRDGLRERRERGGRKRERERGGEGGRGEREGVGERVGMIIVMHGGDITCVC